MGFETRDENSVPAYNQSLLNEPFHCFSDRDGSMYTLQVGDYVRFLLATDRRNQSQRAVSVALDIEKTKELNREEREFGVVAAVKVYLF